MGITGDFKRDILDLVSTPRFGSYQKSDLNLMLFHYAMIETVRKSKSKLELDSQYLYYVLDRQDQGRLAGKLKLPIGRVKNLIESAAALYGEEPDNPQLLEILKDAIKSCQAPAGWYRNGYVALLIHNKALKELLITRLDKLGGFADFSFNQDVLRIPAFDLLRLFGKDDTEIVKAFIQNVKSHNSLNEEQKKEIDVLATKKITMQNRRDSLIKAVRIVEGLAQYVLPNLL